ncbi:MAG: DEAD/DEAH box helicase family protein [Gemmataceae bacterium]
MNEAETCRTLVRPRLEAAGWPAVGDAAHFKEQLTITPGRVVVAGGAAKRQAKQVPDFLLYFNRDLPLAVVEAKHDGKPAGHGMGQAKEYAATLGLQFAYATNGRGIVEFDAHTQREVEVSAFPSPAELFQRWQTARALTTAQTDALLVPDYYRPDRLPRYYQRIAIDAAVAAIVGGRRRCLLTLATGTGKTAVAFQICWKLWSAGWTAAGLPRKPRILFLADRNKLVDDPMAKDFAPFGDARAKLAGTAVRGREMHFALYQALADRDGQPGLYRQYPPDYFDLIVIDECHRGSANDEGRWRDILLYFAPAAQLGMTATPLRQDNRDSYAYFGNPLYTYSLKQGIADGFLAPYRVHRVKTTFDAAGWRPNAGETDKLGRAIPDQTYETKDFERVIALEARTKAIARHLHDHLQRTDPYAKTIVFCVDQEHADDMRRALHNLNPKLAKEAAAEGTEYAARVVSDEGDRGIGYLEQFQDPEQRFPVILTTSQLLTTGVDAPTCRAVVLVRAVGSMTEFKQIIGRGTRLREDHGKLFFTILDYAGSATQRFADPGFDGEPEQATQEEIDAAGQVTATDAPTADPGDDAPDGATIAGGDPAGDPRKLYAHGGPGGIDTEVTYDLAADGTKLRTVSLTKYAAETVKTLYAGPADLRAVWQSFDRRSDVLKELEGRGLDLTALAAQTGHPDADPFDVLCHVAYNEPPLTRRQRADKVKAKLPDLFARFGPDAREVLTVVLDKYADHGPGQFELPGVFAVPPLSARGGLADIAAPFGGPAELVAAVDKLQEYLYAA